MKEERVKRNAGMQKNQMTIARIKMKMTLLIDGKFVNHQQSCVCVTIITLLYPFSFSNLNDSELIVDYRQLI